MNKKRRYQTSIPCLRNKLGNGPVTFRVAIIDSFHAPNHKEDSRIQHVVDSCHELTSNSIPFRLNTSAAEQEN